MPNTPDDQTSQTDAQGVQDVLGPLPKLSGRRSAYQKAVEALRPDQEAAVHELLDQNNNLWRAVAEQREELDARPTVAQHDALGAQLRRAMQNDEDLRGHIVRTKQLARYTAKIGILLRGLLDEEVTVGNDDSAVGSTELRTEEFVFVITVQDDGRNTLTMRTVGEDIHPQIFTLGYEGLSDEDVQRLYGVVRLCREGSDNTRRLFPPSTHAATFVESSVQPEFAFAKLIADVSSRYNHLCGISLGNIETWAQAGSPSSFQP